MTTEAALREALERIDHQVSHGKMGDWQIALAAIRNIACQALSAQPEVEANVERVAAAIDAAQCPGREGPFGGYDYGYSTEFYGPAPKAGRYVIRDFRDRNSPDWGKVIHLTNDRDEHKAVFKRMTRHHIARAAIQAMSDAWCEVEGTQTVATTPDGKSWFYSGSYWYEPGARTAIQGDAS